MADEVDQTADRMDGEISRLVEASKRRVGPVPNGACHWCDAPTTHAFCNAECRDDWQREQNLKLRNGNRK